MKVHPCIRLLLANVITTGFQFIVADAHESNNLRRKTADILNVEELIGNSDYSKTTNTQSMYNDPSATSTNTRSNGATINLVQEPPLSFVGQCKLHDRKCKVCEGDCDDDSDCEEGLSCFIRDSRTFGEDLPVPGCSTNPFVLAAKDFCYNASLAPCMNSEDPFLIGENNEYKLSYGNCSWVAYDAERRCDSFGHHCRETCGYCRPREKWDRWNEYYTKQEVIGPPLSFIGRCDSFDRKCSICEGVCEFDSDCEDGLGCFIRDSRTQGVPVPGCGTNPDLVASQSFCYNMTLAPCKDSEDPFLIGENNTNGDCSWVQKDPRTRCKLFANECRETCKYCRPDNRAYNPFELDGLHLSMMGPCSSFGRKCKMCEGDCDNDADCEEGLSCFIRDDNTVGFPVPGCSTNPNYIRSLDFCYNTSLAPCVNSEEPFPIGNNSEHGNCSWVAYDASTRCEEYAQFCPETCGYCRPREKYGKDVLDPDQVEIKGPHLSVVGRCNLFDRKCKLCEGSCTSDSDCEEGLGCFIRDRYNRGTPVPGCGSNPRMLATRDFCYNMTLAPCVNSKEPFLIDGNNTYGNCSWVEQYPQSRCGQFGSYCRESCGYCRPG